MKLISNGKPIDIFPLCEVISIEENSTDHEYRYIINYKDQREDGNSRSKIMWAYSVFLLKIHRYNDGGYSRASERL
jgi:hypothetical protein